MNKKSKSKVFQAKKSVYPTCQFCQIKENKSNLICIDKNCFQINKQTCIHCLNIQHQGHIVESVDQIMNRMIDNYTYHYPEFILKQKLNHIYDQMLGNKNQILNQLDQIYYSIK